MINSAPISPKTERTNKLTYGEKLVGIKFNPTENPIQHGRVERIKELSAQLIDGSRSDYLKKSDSLRNSMYECRTDELELLTQEINRLEQVFDATVQSILTSQMLAVKLLFVE